MSLKTPMRQNSIRLLYRSVRREKVKQRPDQMSLERMSLGQKFERHANMFAERETETKR